MVAKSTYECFSRTFSFRVVLCMEDRIPLDDFSLFSVYLTMCQKIFVLVLCMVDEKG